MRHYERKHHETKRSIAKRNQAQRNCTQNVTDRNEAEPNETTYEHNQGQENYMYVCSLIHCGRRLHEGGLIEVIEEEMRQSPLRRQPSFQVVHIIFVV